MPVRIADSMKQMNDLTSFPVAYGSDIWLDKNKGSGTSNYSSIQEMYNNSELGGGGSAIQVDLLPHPSVDELGKIYQFVGSTGTYTNGFFYTCVASEDNPPVYSWVQKNVQPSNATATDVSYDNTTSELVATNVQDAIDEIKGGLGTASGKNFTDLVRPNSHELVESGSVYSAINNALSSIYTPRGELTCAELTSSLLIEDNVGNIYTMNDSGTTSALFINGAGLTINVGDNVGIIKAGADTYLFNYMGNAFDLTDYQKKELETPLTIDGTSQTTVEGALGGLNVGLGKKTNVFGGKKSDWNNLTLEEKVQYNATAFSDDDSGGVPSDVYSTTETKTNKVWINGKPIYRKVISLGKLPNATTKTVDTDISNISFVTSFRGTAYNNQDFVSLPYPNTDGNHIQMWIQTPSGSTSIIYIRTINDWSPRTAWAIIEYTKTTD